MEDYSHLYILSKKTLKFLYLYNPLHSTYLHSQGVKVCRIEWEIMSRDHHDNASAHTLITAHLILPHVLTEQLLERLVCLTVFRTGMLTVSMYYRLF